MTTYPLVEQLIGALSTDRAVRKKLGKAGRIHIDRQLPFLCLYRQLEGDDWGTRKLVQSEASYLVMPREVHPTYAQWLVRGVVETLAREFGAFLIMDVRSLEMASSMRENGNGPFAPSFVVRADQKADIRDSVEVLKAELEKIKVHGKCSDVVVMYERAFDDTCIAPFMNARLARKLGCSMIGIDVAPIYRDGDEHYPLVLRALRRGMSRALKRTVHHFARVHAEHSIPSHLALGRRAFARAVFDADKALAEIDNSFDFLLQVTPVNADRAWRSFAKSGYEREPKFVYRPLPFDPSLMKRHLFRVPIERIEDPTIEQLLSEKQHELDQKLSLMRMIGTKRFRYGSMQLFGVVSKKLRRQAEEIMSSMPHRVSAETKMVGARAFARMAAKEIASYQKIAPSFASSVEIRDDMYAGLLVSRGTLLIGKGFSVSPKRARALINHEIGTHVVTYFNGGEQPFRQLQIGLAGYDELQEGLAVLSEYLGGGFSRDRLRMLAGRVIAVHDMVGGAGMVDIFRTLTRDYGFGEKMAFGIALRVCRGGGLTKDAIYLRGLLKILEYLRDGGSIEVLFVGKIGAEHIPLIKELQWRKVITPMSLVPRVLREKRSKERLIALRASEGLESLFLENE